MAAVGLPCWTPGVWADTLWAAGVWRDETTPPPPPPPPPEAQAEALSGGWLTQVARWRGWQAPPRRQAEEEVAGLWSLVSGSEPGTTNQEPGTPVALGPLLASATRLPPLDWAPLLTLAQADQARRQALVQAGEEEELLVLLMLMEVL